MIVRILGEGQFEVADDALDRLNQLDTKLVQTIERDDGAAFDGALAELLRAVRDAGAPAPDDYLGTSEYVLPAGDSTLDEVKALLGEEGLLPG